MHAGYGLTVAQLIRGCSAILRSMCEEAVSQTCTGKIPTIQHGNFFFYPRNLNISFRDY